MDHLKALAGRGPFDRCALVGHLLEHARTIDGRAMGYAYAQVQAVELIALGLAAGIIETCAEARCYRLTAKQCPDTMRNEVDE
jgi:hypothetical protein